MVVRTAIYIGGGGDLVIGAQVSGGSATFFNDDGDMRVNTHFLPSTDASFDLGRSTSVFRWRNVFASGCTGSQCTDIAEYYTATEPLSAGELVMLDPLVVKGVKKATQYGTIIGIISTTPGISLAEGQAATLYQNGLEIGIHGAGEVPVALSVVSL